MAPPMHVHRSHRDELRDQHLDEEIEDYLNGHGETEYEADVRLGHETVNGEPDYDSILKNRKEDAD